jgi:hypothetical protein
MAPRVHLDPGVPLDRLGHLDVMETTARMVTLDPEVGLDPLDRAVLQGSLGCLDQRATVGLTGCLDPRETRENLEKGEK